jgi:uncharacterized protein YegP (UPF0339 family)
MKSSRFVLEQRANQFFFKLKAAGDAEVILTSQRYPRKGSALAGIAAVKLCAACPAQFVRRRSTSGMSHFVLRDAKGEVIGTSKMYLSASARDTGIATVQTHAPDATIEDQTEPTLVSFTRTLN